MTRGAGDRTHNPSAGQARPPGKGGEHHQTPPGPFGMTPDRAPAAPFGMTRGWLLALLALLAAAGLRFGMLGLESLWCDEAYTANAAWSSWKEIWTSLGSDDAPPLYYYLVKGAIAVTGDSEAGIRAFSALCGLAAVAVAWVLARRHAPRSSDFVVVTVAFSAVASFHARQARSYSFLHLAGLLLLLAALELRRRPRLGPAILFLAGGLSLMYAHNLGVLLVPPALGLAVLRRPRPTPRSRWPLWILGAGVILAIPWGLRLLAQVGVHDELNTWMGEWWKHGRPLPLAPLYSWAAFLNGGVSLVRPAVPLPGAGFPMLGALTLALGVVGTLAGLGLLLRPYLPRGATSWLNEDPEGSRRTLVAAALLASFVPLAGLVLVSLVAAPAYVVGRTDSLALPGLLLLLGAGWSCLRPAWAGRACLAVWAISGVVVLAPVLSGSSRIVKQSDRELARVLAVEVRPGDALVFGPLSRPSMEYYGKRNGWWDRLAWAGSFPPAAAANPAGLVPTPLDSAAAYYEQARELRRQWEQAGIRRVLVLGLADDAPAGGARNPQAEPAWPSLPQIPPPHQRRIDANQVDYPMSLLVASLAAMRPVEALRQYRQDWVSGRRLLLLVDREAWAPEDSLPDLEVRR